MEDIRFKIAWIIDIKEDAYKCDCDKCKTLRKQIDDIIALFEKQEKDPYPCMPVPVCDCDKPKEPEKIEELKFVGDYDTAIIQTASMALRIMSKDFLKAETKINELIQEVNKLKDCPKEIKKIPCPRCGRLFYKDSGKTLTNFATTYFTVCEECWNKYYVCNEHKEKK